MLLSNSSKSRWRIQDARMTYVWDGTGEQDTLQAGNAFETVGPHHCLQPAKSFADALPEHHELYCQHTWRFDGKTRSGVKLYTHLGPAPNGM